MAERGYDVHDDGAPLTVVDIELESEIAIADLLDALPDEEVEFADRGGFDTSDEEYGVVVDAIIGEEIGHGEGANLVVGRHYRAQVEDWGRRRHSRCSGGCSNVSVARTGPTASSPATATSSAPAPSGTSRCTAVTCG